MKKLLINAKIVDEKSHKFKDAIILINDKKIEKIIEINNKKIYENNKILSEKCEKNCENLDEIFIKNSLNLNEEFIKFEQKNDKFSPKINEKCCENHDENHSKKSENFCENYGEIFNNFDGEIIECKNNIIMHGFINSCSNLMKNFYQNFVVCTSKIDFNDKFENFISKLNMEEKYLIYKFQILNQIKNGIVCFCDEDFYNLALKKAVKETKINVVYKVGFQNCFDDFDEKLAEKLESEKENFVFSCRSVLENSEENFGEVLRLAKRFNKPIFVNGSEDLWLAGSVESNFQKTATQMLEDYGVLDFNHVIFNNNVLDKSDYEILSIYNSKLVFSPSFNLTFGNKNANIYALDKTNLIGLASFKNNFDLEMFLAKNLENENYNKVETFSPRKLFEFSTKNNAEILNLNGFGEIKEGNFANILMIQNDNLFCDENSFLKNFELNKINSVMINGNLIYNANHFIQNQDISHLKNQCLNIVKKYV